MLMEPIVKMESPFLLSASSIKIEAETENNVIEDVITEAECLSGMVEKRDLCKDSKGGKAQFRSSRLSNKTSVVTSEVNNIYAKPRMHFTGKGIVTKTQPGYSFTLKTKRGRKVKVKEKLKMKLEDVESPESASSPEKVIESLHDEVESEGQAESDSYFLVKKKRDRRFPKIPQLVEDDLIHPDCYMDVQRGRGGDDGREDAELSDEMQMSEEHLVHDDLPINSFLNKKMFKRIGHYSDCIVECTVCYKQMKDTSMKQHYKTHSGAKPFPCNFCGARFTRKGDVYRHRKTIHRNVKPFECSMCERRFVERKSLISHLQNHDRMLYYGCTTCGFKFGKREYYENHIRFIHPLPEGQSLTDVKDIVDKGVKQLEKLLADEKEESKCGRRTTSLPNIELQNDKDEAALNSEVKKEQEEVELDLDEFKVEPPSPESFSSLENENEVEEDSPATAESFVDVDDVSVVKGTLSLTQRLSSQSDFDSQEEEELVNKAIRAAVSQAENALETIQSTIGNNMTSQTVEKTNRGAKANAPVLKSSKKAEPKSCEIHINAMVGGSFRKFIVQIPSGSNIDATTQEGMDTLVNMVNYLCSGKGELNGPVEVVMHHTI